MLSRNTPVAFVVGAAGFVGSHIVEKLLEKGVQVVGLDDFSSGSKDNLEESSKSKHFHFINQSAGEKILLGFPRLDYAYFLISDDLGRENYLEAFDNFLEICKKYKSKIILASSIDLYDLKKESLGNLREAEKKLARFAEEFKLNARVVRTAAVYGPRMHFGNEDPLIRLIHASASDELKKEMAPLDFTTRALFITDIADLLIKAVMHGATSQKIYDGALLHPIKVSEVRQVLLDPLWHESRNFEPTELPPWPTPNLMKTEKELSWKPATPTVVALRKTVSFFKDNPQLLQKQETHKEKASYREENKEKIFSKSTLSDYRNENEDTKKGNKKEQKMEGLHKEKVASFSHSGKKVWDGFIKFTSTSLVIAAIVMGFAYPVISISTGAITAKNALSNSAKAVEEGDYELAEKEIKQAKRGAELINETVEPYFELGKINWLKPQIETTKDLLQAFNLIVEGSEYEALGIKSLHQTLKVVAGEEGDLRQLLTTGNLSLSEGDKRFALAKIMTDKLFLQEKAPGFFRKAVEDAYMKIDYYQKLAVKMHGLSDVLPQFLAIGTQKNYLVLLQDNSRLRPSGGVVEAYAGITFKDGKLVEIKGDKIDTLDKQIKSRVAPPAELRKDTGSLIWQMKDVGFDPDFPTSGKWALWFYKNATGVDSQAVMTLDYSSIVRLLEATGPITLPSSQEKVDSSNFYEKVRSSKDESFTAQVLKELLSKLFFVPKQDWPKIVDTMNTLLDEKHALVFASDAKLLSYVNAQNWTGVLPRQPKELVGGKEDFLAISEANMGNLGLNLDLKRAVDLQINVDENGIFTHKLTVNYSNEDESEGSSGIYQQAVTSGYKNRVRIYLPAGTRIGKGLWGEQDITKDISSFTDYGRAGYSVLLNLQPKETKALVLEYSDSKSIKQENGEIKYDLNIIKQPGTGSDPLNIKLNYPASFSAESSGDQKIPQEILFATDLATNRNFEIILKKK